MLAGKKAETMKLLEVYDSPMCCPTGVCGVNVDPTLARFAGDLDLLKDQGIEVRRFNLAQEPALFAEHPAVKALLERSEGDDLPAIIFGNELVAFGHYPTLEELSGIVGLSDRDHAVERDDKPIDRIPSSCCD